ncbi:hypothetical protein LX36DRAFT_652930 [Colletotrichum falcatum]|nr:hypothetical protein LX36DRAFT_652930 [Colletotrichum falcatum]
MHTWTQIAVGRGLPCIRKGFRNLSATTDTATTYPVPSASGAPHPPSCVTATSCSVSK